MISREVSRLADPWDANNNWPKRLEWLSIKGVRGWSGERIDFTYPIVAIVGENGSGKSTILQAAAAIYKSSNDKDRFASDFFPDTAWDAQTGVEIRFSVREGTETRTGSVRKPTGRWRGNPERREREVIYEDLSRLQPVATRVGYARIARAGVTEANSTAYNNDNVRRLSSILARTYSAAKSAISSIDATRPVTVLSANGQSYSGFHQGAGEMTVASIVNWNIPKNSLVLIDEVETSLHPRAQRRLLRDLAEIARLKGVQFILSTHSPYILEELPERARIQVSSENGAKVILRGVSPYFAMTKMDDAVHYEAEVYVEDRSAKALVDEILAAHLPDRFPTTLVTPCGPASVGKMLGQMVEAGRFARPTAVFLDSDQGVAPGCFLLPDEGLAPERLIFRDITNINYGDIPEMLKRDYADVAAAMTQAITLPDHHQWVRHVSNGVRVPEQSVWQALVGEWVAKVMTNDQLDMVVNPIKDLFE